MASPGNQHCANCIGTLSFPVAGLLFISCDLELWPMTLTSGCDVISVKKQPAYMPTKPLSHKSSGTMDPDYFSSYSAETPTDTDCFV